MSPRSNESSPRPPRGETYYTRTISGVRRRRRSGGLFGTSSYRLRIPGGGPESAGPFGIPSPQGNGCEASAEYRPWREIWHPGPARNRPGEHHRARNTDPVGKEYRPPGESGYRERARQASRETFRALIWRSSMGFPRESGPEWQVPTNTDPVGKEYRPRGERIPSRRGDFYRSRRENLPTPVGYFTERVGVEYRPSGETLQTKPLQIRGFRSVPTVYMVFCLCLMFCLVNREVLGG